MFFIAFALACAQSQAIDNTAPTANNAAEVAAESSTDGTVVATWDEGSLSRAELQESVATELAQMESEYLMNRYQMESQAAGQLALERVLQEAADARGLTIEGMLMEDVEGTIEPATEAEIEAFYPRVAQRLGGAPLTEVHDIVANVVMEQKRAAAAQQYVTAMGAAHNIETSIPFPNLPRMDVSTDGDPSVGPSDAPITIIEFGEFQCPYCGRAQEVVDRLMAEYEGQIQFVYRDFPLGFHDRAIPAAIAANCAEPQGKYWEIHRMMMAAQHDLSEPTLTGYATELDLDMEAWTTCRADPAQAAEVQADMADGSALGITGTPAFFVNGVFLAGAMPYETFKQIIDGDLE
jgi:protein-disulfide isomerase